LGKGVITEVLQTYGYNLYGEYIWGKKVDNKKNNVNEFWLRVNETALVFTNSQTKISEEKLSYFTWSCVTNGEDSVHHEHPCYKPYSCLKPLLSQFLTDTDFVFDPFVGSGALLKAAQTLHKNKVFGIEIVEEWAAKANDLLH
jgi:DNA modification methylase